VGFFSWGRRLSNVYGSPRGKFPLGQTPLGAYRHLQEVPRDISLMGYFPYGILPLWVDSSQRLWEPSGNFPLWDSSPGGRRFLALMGALREFFPCGIFPLGADTSRRLWEPLGNFSPVGFFPCRQTLPDTYRSPQGIFPLWDSSPAGRRFRALIGAFMEIFPYGILFLGVGAYASWRLEASMHSFTI
jgi:hypothetical protein